MKKFLIGFGSFLILLGAVGMINHISMIYKVVQEEQEMHGGSVQYMMVQLISTMGPYLTCLIGGGMIIALASFINEYQKRSGLTAQLIQVLSETNTQDSYTKREENIKTDTTITTPRPATESHQETSANQTDNERFYWKG